ncbi:MAG TPA: Clp protease N-terminal domain-containing protein [Gemmata sp.]|nr:Clp protease N-terminal domain-containing protein [Gemmata sp.]
MFEWLRRKRPKPDRELPPLRFSESTRPFTALAQKVTRLANEQAHRFRHEYIGTEHLLLGLIEVRDGIASRVLNQCNISIVSVREQVERIVQHGPGGAPDSSGRLPFTPRAESALRWTSEEARFLNHDFICTEHILMGLLHEREGVAFLVLRHFGLTADRARDEVIRLSPPGRAAPDT